MSIVLVRPDGQEVTLYRDVVRGPRPGESAPYVRNADAPMRVLLSAESATAEAAAKMIYRRVRRARPRPPTWAVTRSGRCSASRTDRAASRPLPGDYRVEARIAVADPTDEVGTRGRRGRRQRLRPDGHRHPGP